MGLKATTNSVLPDQSGNLTVSATNTYDIGTSAGNRWRNIYASGNVDALGILVTLGGSAAVAGGAQAMKIGSTTARGLYWGSGVPTVSAAQGSLYLRTDGTTTNDRMYVNTNGTTGWTAVTTAA